MTRFDAVRLEVEAKDGHLKVHLRIEKERGMGQLLNL